LKLRLRKLLLRWKLLLLKLLLLKLLRWKLLLLKLLLPKLHLLNLPSNFWRSYEKPAFGPVFLCLQELPQSFDGFGQTRKRLGVGDPDMSGCLVVAEIDSGRDGDAGVI
jgi:hypothetical protein